MATDADQPPDVTDAERAALHRVELAVEWLQRAQGTLIAFHHAVGHAMDHLAEAETELRDCGEGDLADDLRHDYLPRGVVDEERWSYDVLESYQAGFLRPMVDFERRSRDRIADGHRHVAERRQEREWKRRAGDR